jgi:two-component system CheB/CheR fusion protein
LEALEELFSAMPADTGMAFVVVMHLHPGHTSMLPELLAKNTDVKVVEAADGMKLERNHIYICPSGGQFDLLNGTLHRMGADKPESPHLPIDHFFRSLAQDQKERAVGIILSGTGTDGTLGLKAIKAESGMVMVQEVQTAKYSGMPTSAIATGLVDYILPPKSMPHRLVAYTGGPYLLAAPTEGDVALEPLQKIFVVLRTRTGHDFSNYKSTTIRRRIERRMNVHGIKGPGNYVRFLQENPHEVDILFKELLISVTSFFRDPEAFEALAKDFLPELLRSRPDNHVIRIWVPGCATGEEVYSIAILMREAIEASKRPFEVQIFGTDLDSEAIDMARSGQYPDGITLDCSEKRIERYFMREDNGYRVRKDIREMTVFAVQNVIKDPPFTKVDLISCRNLLIYLNSDLQRKLLPLFHYAIRPGGLLLLGPSETVGPCTDLFDLADKKWKIFRRKESPLASRAVMDFPITMTKLADDRTVAIARQPRGGGITSLVERLLLSRFSPASAVVNDRGDVIFIHGRTGQYLEPTAGTPRNNIHEMAREGLQFDLAAAMRQAATQTGEVLREGVRVRTNGDFSYIDLSVTRLTEPETLRGLFLVTFRPCLNPAESKKSKGHATKGEKSVRANELEEELQFTKESLQTTIEELETSNEELKSTNEELQSTNEELQNTNEELETSKEEMQSLNEELTTVNAELQSKVDELSRANDDMQNLLNSTEIATIFLDRDLNIKRFTEQARRLVNLIQTDVGRPLFDLASTLNYNQLVPDCKEVLRSLVFKQAEVQCRDGKWFLMRIMPYRTADNVIDGLVLTFVDVNRVKKAEEELKATKTRLTTELDAMTRLQEIGALFVREGGMVPAVLEEILDVALLIAGTSMGNIQLLESANGRLKMVAHRGFKKPWLEFWKAVDESQGSCGAALKSGECVVVEDVAQSPIFAGKPALEVQLRAGVQAVVSTPLMNHDGDLIGMISTHFKKPHRPAERTLRLLDLLARQAGEIVERAGKDADPIRLEGGK